MIRGLTDEGVAMCATKLRLTPEAVVKVSDVRRVKRRRSSRQCSFSHATASSGGKSLLLQQALRPVKNAALIPLQAK
jgi:hypothetical protein